MISVNMHEAKSRLSELVKAVEDSNEVIVLCRNGVAVAEIKAPSKRKIDRLTPHPDLRVKLHPSFDPTEQATEEDWPEAQR
jgi:antitoxin (DNA-binding transcriptional repressor) of toxin-antitoxin stability system